jgi:glycosyltransferase involved in cell wall biosynthesis
VTDATKPPEISVIIPCFNGADHIREQLEALANECVPVPWEVVIADNGSSDDSREICTEYLDRMPLRMVDASARRGQAHARNVGAQMAGGRKLLFLDQDDVISPGYVAAMESALTRHRFVAATMEYARLNSAWSLEARASALATGLRPGLFPWAYGCVLAADRVLFDALGGFDEDLPCAEDIDLCWRVRSHAAIELHHVAEAVLHYRLKASYHALFAQGLLYGRGGAALYRRWRQAGMARRTLREVPGSWVAIVWRLAAARQSGRRAGAWYLLANRLGCVIGSIQERVVFL